MNYIRKGCCFLYKSLWMVYFFTACEIYTYLFRIRLWFNNVQFGHGITTGGICIPLLRISPKAKIVRIGNYCSFNNYTGTGWFSRSSIWVKAGAILEMGDNSGMNGALLYATRKIIIGKNVKIGGGSRIFDTDFHPLDFELRRYTLKGTKSASIEIGDDVFIGTNCMILKGVTIGARSIIAAGSVVTKSIPSDEIWAGNPAKKIKSIDSK